jgi:hypothetical protein
VSDENCVYLLKLLAGMYTLLKSTLLSPPVYRELVDGVISVENRTKQFISQWAAKTDKEGQLELFELAWWCEAALPRAYLVTFMFSCLPALWHEPRFISDTFSACKALQHPLKGAFLSSRLHSQLKLIYKSLEEDEMKSLWMGYSVECFTNLLRLFVRWHSSLPLKTAETSFIASLYTETFESFFVELAGMATFDEFESVLLPTFLVEIVNCGDSLAQSLIFESIVKVQFKIVRSCLFYILRNLTQNTCILNWVNL